MACSRSQSGRTITGFLPPISSWNFTPRSAAQPAIRRPTGFDPVNETPCTFSLRTSASPSAPPPPVTRFSTPAGSTPASKSCVIRTAQCGVTLAGLNTTVFP